MLPYAIDAAISNRDGIHEDNDRDVYGVTGVGMRSGLFAIGRGTVRAAAAALSERDWPVDTAHLCRLHDETHVLKSILTDLAS